MKKKIFGITLAVCILVLSIASTTIAYFTDTDKQTQVFTAGNVDITLTNPLFVNQSNSAVNVYPGEKIGNAAVITNVGSEQAYVGAIITLKKEASQIAESYARALFENLAPTDDFTVSYDGTTSKFYIVYKNSTSKNGTVKLFDSITIPAAWDHAEMVNFKGLEITVQAYATQTVGMTSAADALAKAFPDVWPAPSPSN